MSAAMRRDVFDPANVKSFAEKVGAPETLENAMPADLCRHQSRESGGHDAVEGGQPMATVYCVRELFEPQRR